jgi:pimeloyl-ACP methyl ester carboxylesterase
MKSGLQATAALIAHSTPVLLTGILFTSLATGASPSPRPWGELIDLGGRKFHMKCQGTGSPAVILESGAGEFSLDWALAMDRISRFTRVCAWDRAGYAWSDISPNFEEFSLAAADMQTLLQKAGVQPPWILAGHGMGALYARDYQHRYPGEVAGLVLIDPMPEEDVQVKMFGNTVSLIDMADHDLVAWPVRPFAPSLTSPPPQRPSPARGIEPPFDKLPATLQEAREWARKRLFEQLDSLSAAQGHQTMESERTAFLDMYNARHTTTLAIPVVVLSRGKDSSPVIRQMQDQLAKISTAAIHRTAESSGTQIQIEQPDLVSSVVGDMVTALRRQNRRTGSHSLKLV